MPSRSRSSTGSSAPGRDAPAAPLVNVLETPRLRLRHLHAGDSAFVLALLNDPSWLRYIGDRGVRTLADGERYIEDGPVAMYAREGFGLWLVERKADGEPLGICGLIRREGLADVDLGFAFLPQFRGQRYAHEAAGATLRHATDVLGLARIVAITVADNLASCGLLERLGFRFERMIRRRPDDDELKLYAFGA